MGIQERKEREFQRREDEILSAALTLFVREDWQAVTIDEIAQAAEIGKGTVYKHFPSKEEIYARLALGFHRGLLQQLRTVPPEQPVLDRLRAMIAAFWGYHLQRTEHQHLVQYCGRKDFLNHITEGTRTEMLKLDREFVVLLEDLVVKGREQGIFDRQKPVPLVLFGVQAALSGGIRMVTGGCGVDIDAKTGLAEVTEFIIAGLTSRATMEAAHR